MPSTHLTDEEREDFLNWISAQTKRAAEESSHHVLTIFRNYAIAAFLVIILAFVWVSHEAGNQRQEIGGVVCKIIKQGDYQAYQYAAEGTINKKQLKRALTASVQYRRALTPAKGCDTSYTSHPNPNAPVKPNTGVAPRPIQKK